MRLPLLRRQLLSERGAFDLGSIVVGVILLGVITAGILVNTTSIVPWAQDRMAHARIKDVSNIQNTYLVTEGQYGSATQLAAKGLIGELPPELNIAVASGGSDYCAAFASPSGQSFHGTSASKVNGGDCSAWVAAQTPADPTIVSCDSATYKTSANVQGTCAVTVTSNVSTHTLTLTPLEPTLAAWSIAVDHTAAGTLSSKVYGNGFTPAVNGSFTHSTITAKTYTVTGNNQGCTWNPAAACNHEMISTAKAPEVVRVELTR